MQYGIVAVVIDVLVIVDIIVLLFLTAKSIFKIKKFTNVYWKKQIKFFVRDFEERNIHSNVLIETSI